MSEKHLTELAWKAIVIKKQVKDGELTKALIVFSKTDEKDSAAQLKALDKILTTAETVKRGYKDDKEVAAYLDEVLKEARKSRATVAEAAKKAPEEKEDETASDAEAEEYQKNFKSKLTEALAKVKARAPKPGEDPGAQLKFVALMGGSASAVLVAANVGGSARKVLTTLAGVASGTFVTGECIFEKNAHTFVVEQVPGGLAKKLSAALRKQTGVSYKVRVRTPDGSVQLDDETDVDSDEAAPVDPAAQWKALKTAMYPAIKTALEGNPPNRTDIIQMVGEATKFEKAGNFEGAIEAFNRLQALLGKAGATEDEETSGTEEEVRDWDKEEYEGRQEDMFQNANYVLQERGGDAGKIRAVMAFAQEKAEAGNFKAAAQALTALEKLIDAAGDEIHARGEAAEKGDGDGFSKVAFEKVHLEWDSRKKTIEGRLASLHQAITGEFDDSEASTAASNLAGVLARFNDGLGDTIDQLRNAETPDDRARLAAKARKNCRHLSRVSVLRPARCPRRRKPLRHQR